MWGQGIWVLAACILLSFGSAIAADFGASLGGSPSRAAVEPVSVDVRALQEDLIWTGDYNGMVDGAVGPNTRRAIKRWQGRLGISLTGEISPEQAVRLRIEAGSVRAGFGWTLFRHPDLGYEIAYPAAILGQSRPLAYGGREFLGGSRFAGLKVEVTPPIAETDFRALYSNLSASRDGRQIRYSRRGTDWLVVAGETESQGFYTRIVRRAGAVAGYTFTWPNIDREQFEPAVIAMASSFKVPEQFEPGAREPVDPRHGIALNPSPAPLPRSRQSTALPPMPGPPSRVSLDARGVFRAVNAAVWVVLAAPSTPAGIDKERLSLGSAVAISERHLLTNCHTLEGRDTILVFHRADDPEPVSVEAVYLDRQSDRCILVSPVELSRFVAVRPLEDLEVGERVYTVGAPSGLDLTLGEGIISSLRASNGLRYIQTTAPISPGSSGGGLFDSRGNLIGITTFLVRDAQNLNFALAASDFWQRQYRD